VPIGLFGLLEVEDSIDDGCFMISMGQESLLSECLRLYLQVGPNVSIAVEPNQVVKRSNYY